jgi:predicted chitinase
MAENNTSSEYLDKNGNPLRGAALAARKEKLERQKNSPEEDNQKPKLESIKESVGSSLKSFFGKGGSKVEATPTPEKESGGDDANAFLKIIAKNFMSIHLMARDLNVARQNSIKLVKLEGGEATNKADAQFLKAGEREAKLESERAKEQESRKPTPEKAPAAKKPKSFMDKIKEQFGINKIIKSFTKYFMLAGIVLIVWDLFKESFTEWVGTLWESIKEQFDEWVSDFKKWFDDVVQPIIDKVKEIIQPIIDAVKKVVDAISNWFGEKIDLFAQEFPQTFAFIKGVIDKVIEYINIVKEKLKFVTEAYDKATAKLKSVTDAIAEKLGFGKKKEEEKPKPGQPTQRLKLDEKGQFVPMTKEEVDAENKRLAAKGIPPPVVYPVTTPSGKEVPAPPPKPTAAPTTAPTPAPAPSAKPPSPSDAKPSKIGSETGKKAMLAEMDKEKITDPTKRAAIMAQVGHESGDFTTLSENLNYKAATLTKLFPKKFKSPDDAQQVASGGPKAVAERIYGGRMGNAPEGGGEGYEYRGRGFIQLTGKQNYTRFGYANNPEELTQPAGAAESALKYMAGYKGDWSNITAVTKFVNGGTIGLEDRQKHFLAYVNDPKITSVGAAPASAPSGSQVASSSSAVASEQRQQQKPTTPIVVNAPTTNNKVVNNTQVAQAPAPKDTAINLAARAA